MIKNILAQFWNYRPLGIVIFLLVLIQVILITVYERLISLF